MCSGTLAEGLVEVVHEEPNPNGSTYKVLLRILDKKWWGLRVVRLLQAGDDSEDEFGVSIRKEYFLGEGGAPSYVWVMLLWGSIEGAVESLKPILSEAPPAEKDVPDPPIESSPRQAKVKKRTLRTEDGVRVVTTVPLPHYRGPRTKSPEAVKRFGTKGFGATVTSLREG